MSVIIITTQLMIIVPYIVSSSDAPALVAKYTKTAYNAGTKGYVLNSSVVSDNENFTSAVELVVADGTLFNSTATRDPAIYVGDNSTQSIKDWTSDPDAEMRFYIKSEHAFTATLRLQHSYSGSYNNATYALNVAESDKWQEIRIKRSEFSASASFDTALKGAGSVNLQFIVNKNTFAEGDKLLVSPIEFYDGAIMGEIDPDGGTIDSTPKAGSEIARYDSIGYRASTKPYITAVEAVADNENFSSAVSLKISDIDKYNTAGGDAVMYAETTADADISAWAKTAYAEMWFYIRVPHEVTFTIRLQHYNSTIGYNNATYKITVPASDKWQEIRIKRSDFTASGTFNDAVKEEGKINLQLLTDKNATDFMSENETLYMSPISFYDGFIAEEIDPDGGTVSVTPTAGTEIGKFSTIGYLNPAKPYTTAVNVVADNVNFTSAVSLKIINADAYNSVGGDAAIYAESVTNINISEWASKPFADMRFWIKVPHAVTFTLRIIHSSNGTYTKIINKLTLPASDKWQEIRISREAFTGDAAFNDVIGTDGSVNIQILTDKNATDFMQQDEELLLSPVSFYDGYIEGEIDPEGGTITITPTDGEKITEYATESWNSADKGYTISNIAVADNKNFKVGREFTVTNASLYYSQNRDAAIFNGNNTDNSIVDWVEMPYNQMRFWIKTSRVATFTVRLMNNTDGKYTGISKEITVPASDKWQEIRISRGEFSGSPEFDSEIAKKGTVHFQILTSKETQAFIKEGESISISPIEFYDGLIPGEIDPSGGTVVIPDIYGKLLDSVPATVIKSLDGAKLQLISVYDNDFVSQALKMTITDEDIFYGNKTQVNVCGMAKPADMSGWYDYQKAQLRFWVKVPHDIKLRLQIVERIGSKYPYIETTVEIDGKNGWQQIKLPRSAFSSNVNFTGENIQYIRILPMDYSTSDGYLEFCESLYISQVEFYDGIIPKSADNVDKGKAGKLINKFNLVPYVGNGTSPERITVTDNSNFKSAVTTLINEVRTFSSGEGAHVIHNDKVTDISLWHKNPNAELRFWIKSEKDVTLQLGLQNPAADDASSYRAIWAQISVKGSDKWQEVRLSSKHFSNTAGFDPSRIRYIKIKGIGDEAITTNEIFYISDIEVYDGYIAKASDKNGGTTATVTENAIIATFSDFEAGVPDSNVTVKETAVDTNKHFVTSYVFSSKSEARLNTILKTYYDTFDISRAEKGTLRLWVKSAKATTFNIVLTDKNGKQLVIPFKAEAKGDKWQELRAELKNIKSQGFDFTKLFTVAVTSKLKSGSSLQLCKMELWKNTLTTEIDPDGGEIAPPLVLPPVWDELPTMPADEENRILINTSNSDFWTGDWNDTSRPRSFAANNRGLDKKDINYSRFKIYKELAVLDSAVYYKNPTPAMFYFRKTTDITPYLKTGTLRFWINVPKNMTIKVTLQSVDDANKYSTATVELNLKKVTENNGFQEIQIPLKAFYDAAVKAGIKWNPYFVKHILIGGEDGCDKNSFLKEGELLNVSHFEIWKSEALEPEPFDPTRVFYSLHGDIFLKDVDDVLSKTAMLSAYRDSLNFDKYKKIVEKYYKDAGLLQAYTIQLVSAGQYDYNIVTAYDNVAVYIPLSDGLDIDSLAVSVYNNKGLFDCEFEISDGYIVVTTNQFGEFLIMDSGKRNSTDFDYKSDMGEYFALLELTDNTVNTSEKESKSNLLVLIACIAAVLFAVIAAAVILLLKKKGIISGKGKV